MSNSKLHAMMISLPFQGHINPTVNLALKLASKGVTVTFAHFEFVHHVLSKGKSDVDPFSEAKASGLDIRYTTISDGLSLEYDRSLNWEDYWMHLYKELPALADEFIAKTIETSDPSLVPFMVGDTSCAWLAGVAKKYNLVSVSFWTTSALVFYLSYHADPLLKEHGHFPCKDELEEEMTYLPGVESMNTRDLMPYFKQSQYGSIACETLLMAYKETKNVDFVLHNLVQELEPETLAAINKLLPSYAIGPLNFSNKLAINKNLHSSADSSDLTRWLGSKIPGSVLYVSFGSVVQTNREVIQEVASGLVLSGVNFIWVIRSDLVSSEERNLFPDGFEDEIKERGLIVPWCDQIMVLSDPAVGGFMTHCGWNSITESIWCGVPMICYPFAYDQPTNRKLMVDWKIGVNLCDAKSFQKEILAENIRSFMCKANSEGMKEEIRKVQATYHNAVSIGGSSERNINQFIIDLKAKIHVLSP